MTAQTRSVPNIPAPVIVGAAMLAALAAGRLFAQGHTSIALAVVLAAAYVPLVFLDFPIALAIWAGMLYVSHLSVLSVAPNAIGVLLVVGWLAGGVVSARSARMPVLARHRHLLTAVVLFTAWLGLSRIWSENPGLSEAEVTFWTGPLTFVVVAMTVHSARHVQIIAVALIAGAAVSVLIGLAGGDLSAVSGSVSGAAEGRLRGGGDPNYEAAGYVAALFLAGGLLSVLRGAGRRLALVATMMLVTFGFFATQSRGGLLALGFASLFALIVTPRHRGRILGLIAAAGAGLAAFLSSNPEALARITQAGGGGSGRVDLWTVAWRIFQAHPVVGTGLDSFQRIAPRYVLEPGPLTHVRVIAESPHVVHNTYLQLLAETGIVGLTIFVVIIVASLRSSWLAARRFDAIGQHGQANLARALLTGTAGILAAMFFISDATSYQLWILFALGPVMLTMARATATATAMQLSSERRAQPLSPPPPVLLGPYP